MTLSGSDIRRLEELARIELKPEERERLGMQLARIVEFVRVLQGASPPDAAAIEGPGVATDGAATPLDEDLPRDCLDRGEVLAAAPADDDGFYRVPPVIETERT